MLDNKIITDHSGKIPLKYRLLSNILRGASKIPNRYRKGIGHILGWLLWQLPLKMNRIAAINIQHCHQGVPQCYVDTLIKQNALLVGQAFLYTAVAWYGTRQQIVDHLTHKILGLDQIKKCQQSGKGVLLLAMHSLFLELDG